MVAPAPFEQSLVPSSLCPPSPFLYTEVDEESESLFTVSNDDSSDRYINPTIRADRLVAYLQSLKQDYELPEISFIETEVDEDDVEIEVSIAEKSTNAPQWCRIK